MASVAAAGLPMRDDEVTDGAAVRRSWAMRRAPARGFFAVPKVVE